MQVDARLRKTARFPALFQSRGVVDVPGLVEGLLEGLVDWLPEGLFVCGCPFGLEELPPLLRRFRRDCDVLFDEFDPVEFDSFEIEPFERDWLGEVV